MTQECVPCLFGAHRHATTWHKVGDLFGDIGILNKTSTFGYTVYGEDIDIDIDIEIPMERILILILISK